MCQLSCVKCHVSSVMCQVSGETCQLSHVRCHMSGRTDPFGGLRAQSKAEPRGKVELCLSNILIECA